MVTILCGCCSHTYGNQTRKYFNVFTFFLTPIVYQRNNAMDEYMLNMLEVVLLKNPPFLSLRSSSFTGVLMCKSSLQYVKCVYNR